MPTERTRARHCVGTLTKAASVHLINTGDGWVHPLPPGDREEQLPELWSCTRPVGGHFDYGGCMVLRDVASRIAVRKVGQRSSGR